MSAAARRARASGRAQKKIRRGGIGGAGPYPGCWSRSARELFYWKCPSTLKISPKKVAVSYAPIIIKP
jgi:hypothetical protein